VHTLGAVRRAALLVGLQALVLAVAGVALGVHGLAFEPDDRTGTLLVALSALVAAALVGLVARGLLAVRPWAWSPTVLIQVFLTVFAVGAVQSRAWALAVPAGFLVLAVGYQLALPEARDALRR
jgi:hypothetical protein